jgi:hypothetical protein
MFNTELTTYKTGGGALSDKSMHPGEYGRVSAWIKKIKNDLVLNKDIYAGHPPSTVFDRPASQCNKLWRASFFFNDLQQARWGSWAPDRPRGARASRTHVVGVGLVRGMAHGQLGPAV